MESGLVAMAGNFSITGCDCLLNTLAILFYKEPVHPKASTDIAKIQTSLLQAVRQYLAYFSSSVELKAWLMVLTASKSLMACRATLNR